MSKDAADIRIAVVDDDPMILKVFSSMMKQTILHADFFESSHEAFKAMVTHPDRYDLLITDIVMPDGDGVDFAKKVRVVLSDLPIMFMTGFATEERKKEALTLGRVEFLEKPFPFIDALELAIRKFIGQE
ncbi:MAG: hypothetical protein AUJ72_03650 [Candidatus Omnitrophica bacterium CG1_02_46_14]|nr:MAG: hypothetical protein AUJ72_03650 [Candidatus Omnitrophica bacterium CG1_02_46_14]